jgi:hypothetical protein
MPCSVLIAACYWSVSRVSANPLWSMPWQRHWVVPGGHAGALVPIPDHRCVRRLAQEVSSGVLLVDGPGVVRGVAGAELLLGIAEAAAIEVVLVLAREGQSIPLGQELLALSAEVFALWVTTAARRPGKRLRARERTRLWDAQLVDAVEQHLEIGQLRFIGAHGPGGRSRCWKADVPSPWVRSWDWMNTVCG